MNHEDKVKAIQFIKPGAEFALRGDVLEWLDKNQVEPTEKEIEFGLIAFEKSKAEAAAKKDALLERLGITAEEAKLLLS